MKYLPFQKEVALLKMLSLMDSGQNLSVNSIFFACVFEMNMDL